MALSPLQPVEERAVEVAPVVQPTKTYIFDLNGNQFEGINDGEPAIRQFIRKAILTARFRFLIYSDDYGCELVELIGQDVPFELLETEIPRVITEALIYDDRVANVIDFVITREGDKLNIQFKVVLSDDTQITEEVTI